MTAARGPVTAGFDTSVPRNVSGTWRLRTLWRYRELIRNLVARDLKVRYRDSAIGFAWSLLNPLLMMLVFTMVFSVLLRSAPTDIPYPPFILTALIAWNFFQISVVAGAGSIVGSAGLVTKVYFPREVLPISAVIVNGVNFLLALLVLIPVTVLFGIAPDGNWLLLPVVLLSEALFTLGITLIVAGLNVFYRDTEYIVEVALLAWFFLTPIFYDIRQVTSAAGSEIGTLLLALNPMATYVTGYRSIFLTHTSLEPAALVQSMLEGLVVCVVGYLAFVRMSRNFGDVL